jgi:polyhydroxyalkanoate synthesis regulator phasin
MQKALFAGLGVVFYTREKLEDVIKDLIHGGHLTREQGTKVLEELAARGREGKDELAARFGKEVAGLVTALRPVSRAEFDEVLARLLVIERRLGREPGAAPPGPGAESE